MTADGGDNYDRTPYKSVPFAHTLPDRLAALAHLLGLTYPPLDSCRVLELGCASGGNLIPMALRMPNAEFLGVDLSRVQIAEGKGLIASLGLSNVRLEPANIADIGEELGSFDYIIAHGVYSWVPADVQERILKICARQLSQNGIAYISYNALPGWRMRGTIRDLMQYHANQFDDPAERVRQARAILDFLAKSVSTQNNAYAALLKSELDVLSRKADYYILHEHLEEHNEPIYFHQFVERAAVHGLQYLADADFSRSVAANLEPEVAQTLRAIAPDVVRQEQFIDFLRNNTFRQTLLVHGQRSVDRNVTPDRITSLWISGSLQPCASSPDIASGHTEEFRAASGVSFRTAAPITKAAAVVLGERWPQALAFADLLAEAREKLGRERQSANAGDADRLTLATDAVRIFAAGLLELHAMPSPFVARVGERPCVSPLARLQARQATIVTNLRHESVHIDENVGRFLQLVDGTRNRNEIESAFSDTLMRGDETRRSLIRSDAIRDEVGKVLHRLSKSALLIDEQA